ncbi:MAG: PH domain-containing protein [Acidimicrobiia bacterium]|nr:PH domain-containing protein [Acidimicrobiia bacterium]
MRPPVVAWLTAPPPPGSPPPAPGPSPAERSTATPAPPRRSSPLEEFALHQNEPPQPLPFDAPSRTSPLTALSGGLYILIAVALTVGTMSSVRGAAEGWGPADFPITLLLVQIGLVVRGLSDTVGWWFRTYRLEEDQLVLDQGILARRRKVVPYRRLQQVDISRGPVAQLVGLAAVRFSTAGDAGSSAVTLRYLDHRQAEVLRSWLLATRDRLTEETTDGGPSRPPPPERPILALEPARLVLAAVTSTSNLILVGIALLAAVVLTGANVLIPEGPPARLVGLTTSGIFLMAFGVALGTVTTLLDTWQWELASRGDDLVSRRGLLTTRNVSLPRRRVQLVMLSDNPVRRALGVVQVSVDSAAPAGASDGARIVIPLVDRAHVADLLQTAMGTDQWVPPPLTPRTAPALRRAVLRRVVLCALLGVLLVVAWAVPGTLSDSMLAGLLVGVLVVATAIGVPWGRVAHARAGWARTGTVVSFAAGVISHVQSVQPINRIQSARTTASPFQRRVGLATCAMDVAGATGAPSLYDMDAVEARHLRQELPRRAAVAPAPMPADFEPEAESQFSVVE